MGLLWSKSSKSPEPEPSWSTSTSPISRMWTPALNTLEHSSAPTSEISDFVLAEENGGPSSLQKMSVNDFELLCLVGKGSFGKVLQVKKKDTGCIYAMKILRKSAVVQRRQVAHTKTERRVLAAIEHPFITKLRYAFQTKHKLYMVIDFFNGGELFYWLKKDKKFPEERARFYAAQILLALECLHKNKIVYRDLKPENLLLDLDGFLKVADFGLSKESIDQGDLTHTFCGTAEYLAPEVLKGKGYGIAVDWWSFGTLLYEMLTGLPPFYNQNTAIMYDRILNSNLKYPDYLSEDAKSILSQLLQRDANKRLGSGSGDADDLKRHPFFASIDFEKLLKKEVEPPFRPPVNGILDTANIDDEFKREIPCDSPVPDSRLPTRRSVLFSNFTYVSVDALGHKSSIGTAAGEEHDAPEQNQDGKTFFAAEPVSSSDASMPLLRKESCSLIADLEALNSESDSEVHCNRAVSSGSPCPGICSPDQNDLSLHSMISSFVQQMVDVVASEICEEQSDGSLRRIDKFADVVSDTASCDTIESAVGAAVSVSQLQLAGGSILAGA